ncbi:AMP-binding enzyme C-terminal domain protein, partial [Bordetella holmesii H620]
MSNAIQSVLVETRVFPPPERAVKGATISGMDAYRALAEEAERDPDGFWGRHARENLQWTKPFTEVLDESDAPFYRWFGDGELNVSANCLDVHLTNGNADKTAIIFESDDGKVEKVSYRELLGRVCRFANGLTSLGYKKGDRAIIYMPMSVEAVVAMQACARLGVTHSVVFGGFSAKSLQERIVDVGASLVITADEQVRGGKVIPLKPAVEEAIAMGGCEAVTKVIVYRRTGGEVAWTEGRDLWMHDVQAGQSDMCEPV